MRHAVRLSAERMREGAGGPFGAVIVKDGKVIAEGWNEVTSANDPTAHAEVVAIRLACEKLGTFSLEGCDIYASCEPCPMCLAAIYWARIDRIFFANTREEAAAIGFDDEFLYREIPKPIAERSNSDGAPGAAGGEGRLRRVARRSRTRSVLGIGDWGADWGTGRVTHCELFDQLISRSGCVAEGNRTLRQRSYRLTELMPKSEEYRLVGQLVRAAASVPANIAEGNARGSRKEYAQHFDVSRAALLPRSRPSSVARASVPICCRTRKSRRLFRSARPSSVDS